MSGIWDLKVAKTPIAIIDFETTGLTAGIDRVVEATAVRLDPDSNEFKVVFDSIINPQRKVDATFIHGLTDSDVADAPTFREILPDFLGAISGCVVASYNIYFDIKFLEYEMRMAGVNLNIPHFCIMYLRSALKGEGRIKLADACKEHKVILGNGHRSFDDTVAAANLLHCYFTILHNRKQNASFKDLANTKRDYKFWDSFHHPLVPDPLQFGLRVSNKVKSRSLAKEHLPKQYDTDNAPLNQKAKIYAQFAENAVKELKNLPPSMENLEKSAQTLSTLLQMQMVLKNEIENSKINNSLASYTETIQLVVSDYIIEDSELELVKAEQKRLNLSKEHIRAVHAKIFSSIMADFIDDEFLDDEEAKKLQKVWKCLHTLGWAPGLFNVQT
jgi:DNA polymerase III epsilon subunit-like protein